MNVTLNAGLLSKLRPVLSVSATMPISEVMQTMVKRKSTAACVMRRDKLVGIFTMSDVMKKVLGYKTTSLWKMPRKRKIRDVAVGALMTPNPVTVSPVTSLGDALAVMKKNKIRHLPVIEETGLLYGLITLQDIANSMRQEVQSEKSKQKRLPQATMYFGKKQSYGFAPVKIRN
jgi:CBS domain-containing protein